MIHNFFNEYIRFIQKKYIITIIKIGINICSFISFDNIFFNNYETIFESCFYFKRVYVNK